jgi:hypothetical protein
MKLESKGMVLTLISKISGRMDFYVRILTH